MPLSLGDHLGPCEIIAAIGKGGMGEVWRARDPRLGRAKPADYSNPALSPDGKRVALVVTEGGSSDIWVYDPQRDAMTRLTFGGGTNFYPVWSPDG